MADGCTTSFPFPPLFSSYNDKIRPVIDTIDKLRSLKVIEQSIPDPTIIVAGENHSGKARLIESLVGFFPPYARKASSKTPLIMRFQNHPNPEFVLKYQKKSVRIMKESLISNALNQATVEIAGAGKTIANVPLTLVVKKKGIPDLTIIYLPGKYWHSISEDKSRDIFEHISDITKEYINPKESIILKVSCVGAKLPPVYTRLRSSEDKREERTLAVITKCDHFRRHIDLSTAISENKFKMRIRYHFIRNRISDETHEDAQIQENTLFETCDLLSNIEKSMVGIRELAIRLANIHLAIILRCLPDIAEKMDEGIRALDLELSQLPRNPLSIPDALTAFMRMVWSMKETLQNILIKGDYEEYIDDKKMHCNARLVEMLDGFSKKLKSRKSYANFLVEEMDVVKEANGIWLPISVPNYVVLCLLKRKLTNISTFPIDFVKQVWDYLEVVCVKVLIDHHGDYPQLVSSMRKALQNVMEKMKVEFLHKVEEMIEMEKTTNYTCDPDFVSSCNKLMGNRDAFLKAMCNHLEEINLEGHDELMMINVKHLFNVPGNTRDQAFDLKMRMTCYWEIVLKRMVDWMALELQFMVQKVVNKEMEMEMVKEVMVHGGGIENVSEELSSSGKQSVRLQRSIALFQKSQQIIDQVRTALLFQPTRGTL